MRHDSPLYPLWLGLREALLDSLPEHLRAASAYTCGGVADHVVERVRDHVLVRRLAALEALARACRWTKHQNVPDLAQVRSMDAALAAVDDAAVPVGDHRPGRYAPERLAALEEVARWAGRFDVVNSVKRPEALARAVAALRALEEGR